MYGNEGVYSRRKPTALLVLDLRRHKMQLLKHPASLLVNARKPRSCCHHTAFYCQLLETVVEVAHDDATVRVWFGSASQETVPVDETRINL